MLELKDIVDTVKYPIDHPDKNSLSYKQFVGSVKQEFMKSGIVTLPGFLKPRALENITAELNLKSDKAWKNGTPHNIYLDDGDQEYKDYHIRNRTQSSQVSHDQWSHFVDISNTSWSANQTVIATDPL